MSSASCGPIFLLSLFQLAMSNTLNFITCTFWAHLVYQPKGLVQSYLVRRASSSLELPVYTFPSHRFKHRNFIFGTHMHKCPQKCTSNIQWFWLVVFKWQLSWYFSLICYVLTVFLTYFIWLQRPPCLARPKATLSWSQVHVLPVTWIKSSCQD